ncbi:HAD family sugar phosphatase [Lactobacillus selangorensis]|uniref:HAD family sugar phosphatase n=1 Tax=Lactobacillus selangorensis TaxID=81857 RepID=A0A0R2G013_9LACO|nr:HAD family phosphatase [Lactobacillus selangorensis]KRN29326.1 HAD family sugar phosphatase [Lactobacillus selangorensis]KRN34145.1 HAD family sugar phosphatase [Lactobacillus selangorensis]
MQEIEAVIFDMDGVLVNSEPYYFDRRREYFQQVGLHLTEQQLLDLVGGNLRDLWPQLLPGRTAAQYQQLQDGYRDYKAADPIDYRKRVNPDAKPTLDWLHAHDFKVGLASSSDLNAINAMLTANHFEDEFDVVVSGMSFTRSKPDPEIYLNTMQQMHVAPEQAMAVEDSETGIAAGEAAGMTVAALAPMDARFTDSQAAADLHIQHLTDLETILRRP